MPETNTRHNTVRTWFYGLPQGYRTIVKMLTVSAFARRKVNDAVTSKFG